MVILQDIISPLPADPPGKDVTRGISGTAAEGTLCGLASSARDSMKMPPGPTTPVLFYDGIDIIPGSVVAGPDTALMAVRRTANFRQPRRTGAIGLVKRTKNREEAFLHERVH